MPTEIRVLREPSHHVNNDDNDEDMSSPFSSGSSFTKKLYDIIDSADSTEVVSWSKDGTSFEVKDPKRLELEILPKYFRHARFQSFVRQLNFYSFKKISKERNSWVYSHEFFQRGRPDLLEHLRRKTNTSSNNLLLSVSSKTNLNLSSHGDDTNHASTSSSPTHRHKPVHSRPVSRSSSLSNLHALTCEDMVGGRTTTPFTSSKHSPGRRSRLKGLTGGSLGGMGYDNDHNEEDFMPSIFHTQHRPSQFFPHALPQSFMSAPMYDNTAFHAGEEGYINTGGSRGGPRGVRKSRSASYISLLSAVACADQLGLSMARGSGDNYSHQRGSGPGLGPGQGGDPYDDEHDHGGVFIDEEDQEGNDEDHERLGPSFLMKMGGMGGGSRNHPPHQESSLSSPRKTRRVGSFSTTHHLNHSVNGGGDGNGNGMMMSGESSSSTSEEVSDSGGSLSEGVSSNHSSEAIPVYWSNVQGMSHQISSTASHTTSGSSTSGNESDSSVEQSRPMLFDPVGNHSGGHAGGHTGGMGMGGVGVRQTGMTTAGYYHGHGISTSNNYYNHPHPHEGLGYDKHPSSSSSMSLPSSSTKSTGSTSMHMNHMNLQQLSLSLSDKETGVVPSHTQPLSLVVDGLPSTQSDPATSPRLPSGSRSPSMASDASGGGSQLSSYQLHALRLQEQHEQRRKSQQQAVTSNAQALLLPLGPTHLISPMSASLSLASTMRVRDPFNVLHAAAIANEAHSSTTDSGSDNGTDMETKRRSSTSSGSGKGPTPSPLNNLCSSSIPTDIHPNHPLLHAPSSSPTGSTKSPRSSTKRTISPTLHAPGTLSSSNKSTCLGKSNHGQDVNTFGSFPTSFDQPLSPEGRKDSHANAGNSSGSGSGSGTDGSVQKRKRRQSFDITQFLPDNDASSSSGANIASALLNAYGSNDNLRGNPPTPTPTSTLSSEEEGIVGMGGNDEDLGGFGLGPTATAATHSVVSFCMQRNPWRYTNETPTHVPLHIEQQPELKQALQALDVQVHCILGPGPATLYRDIAAYLLDAPALRAELEGYADALTPTADCQLNTDSSSSSSSSSSSMLTHHDMVGRNRSDGGSVSGSGSDTSRRRRRDTGGVKGHRWESDSDAMGVDSDSNDSNHSPDSSSHHHVVTYTSRVSPRQTGPSKGNILEDMRTFTSFERRKQSARRTDRDLLLGNWAGGIDGTAADAAADKTAQALVSALKACAATWWEYANLYK